MGVKTFPLTGVDGLVARNVKIEAVEFKGRKAVRVTREPGVREDGFALLPGVDFQDGTIELDVAVKLPPPPPGGRMPGFLGIAFRARPDSSSYELFYLRPGNGRADDQAMRNHAAQYTSEPDYSWYKLRREWPWVYEASVDLQPETWTPVKIEVAGRVARLYLHNAAQPTLIVDGLKGRDLHGNVAFWGTAGEEAYFSNVRVTPAAPQPVTNGSDAAGAWQVRFNTDTGPYNGTLQLQRNDDALTGTWSGDLGENRTVKGAWRDGYVELTFTGDWKGTGGAGAPGPVGVTLAGWIDGASGKGRMKIEGRTDGQWTATRK